MKTLSWFTIFLLLVLAPVTAQELYGADELDEIVGPVAMYPDPLLSNVLTAATEPNQIQRAQLYLETGQPVTEDQPEGFDSSVHALMSYPDVIAMMVENDDWTNALGWASANQLSDVMEAIQRFRYQARTAGSLQTNEQVQVIEEGTVIRVEPADPEIVYVPVYEPYNVVVPQPSGFETFLRYSAGIATNVLLWHRVFNWHDYRCYRAPYGWRPPSAYYRPYGGNAVFQQNNFNVWAPNRNTVINRPTNISNRNFQNINHRGGGNRIGSGNRVGTGNRVGSGNRAGTGNRVGQPDNRLQPRNNPRVSQPPQLNNRRPGARPPVARPNNPVNPGSLNRQAPNRNVNRTGNRNTNRTSRPANRPAPKRNGMSNYSRTSGTVRSSQRGAQSRGSRSYSGGSRSYSGGRSRSGGARRGGGRRR